MGYGYSALAQRYGNHCILTLPYSQISGFADDLSRWDNLLQYSGGGYSILSTMIGVEAYYELVLLPNVPT